MTVTKTSDEKYCHECGEVIRLKAEICPKCGVRQPFMPSHIETMAIPPGQHQCVNCKQVSPMKTWLRNYNLPQIYALLGLCFYFIPGIAFIAWAWGKRKCPKCGKVAVHIPG